MDTKYPTRQAFTVHGVLRVRPAMEALAGWPIVLPDRSLGHSSVLTTFWIETRWKTK
jgi:hypothetical protein